MEELVETSLFIETVKTAGVIEVSEIYEPETIDAVQVFYNANEPTSQKVFIPINQEYISRLNAERWLHMFKLYDYLKDFIPYNHN